MHIETIIMASYLSEQVYIGKDTETKLIQIGIENHKQLEAVGSEDAFLRLHALDPGACIRLLYGLEGTVQGIKSIELSDQSRLGLSEFFKMAK